MSEDRSGSFGVDVDPACGPTNLKSPPNNPDRTSANFELQPHELKPHPWIADAPENPPIDIGSALLDKINEQLDSLTDAKRNREGGGLQELTIAGKYMSRLDWHRN